MPAAACFQQGESLQMKAVWKPVSAIDDNRNGDHIVHKGSSKVLPEIQLLHLENFL